MLAKKYFSWWRHQMETFSALLAVWTGNSPVIGEFSKQRPVTRSYHVFFDLRLNKRLSKQSCGWWLETPSHPLLRHFNDNRMLQTLSIVYLWMSSSCRQSGNNRSVVRPSAAILFTYRIYWLLFLPWERHDMESLSTLLAPLSSLDSHHKGTVPSEIPETSNHSFKRHISYYICI